MLGAHILSHILHAHSDAHPPHTLRTAFHPLFLQIQCLTSIRWLSCFSLECHEQKYYTVFLLFFLTFLSEYHNDKES